MTPDRDPIVIALYPLFNPPVELIVISAADAPTDDEVTDALRTIRDEDPDSYALLLEHVVFPDYLVPE